MNEDPRCKSCWHFHSWPSTGGMYFDSEPDGVCAAPRPLLGPAPNREVKRTSGKNCPSWKDANK